MIDAQPKRYFLKIFWGLCIFFILLFGLGELGLRFAGITPPTNIKLSVKPHALFQPDSVLGWKNGPGQYQISLFDTSMVFTATVNKAGNRITSPDDTTGEIVKEYPVIQVYGCSCTFGFSLDDSLNLSYQLQKRLKGFKVENKGVPGYGLPQMYLSLKQSLLAGDTPSIAVFNYGGFLDERIPINKQFSCIISWCMAQSNGTSNYEKMTYPYFDYSHDSLELKRCQFKELTHSWYLSEKFRFIGLLNILYWGYSDSRSADHRHRISHLLALDIMSFCKSNNIIAVFASIENSSTDIINDLSQKGFFTLDYGIDFSDPKYNCSPYDPTHPNGLAHSIYAQKLYDFFEREKIIPRKIPIQ